MRLLIFSLALNCVLAGLYTDGLLEKVQENPKRVEADKVTERSVQVAVLSPSPVVPSNVAPFNWSQIDSSDFPTYISNLRSIGCPEATIRDIVASELHRQNADKRQQLEQRLATMGSGHSSAGQAVQNDLQKLADIEKSQQAMLLSSQPATSAGDNPFSFVPSADAPPPLKPGVALGFPLALQGVPSSPAATPGAANASDGSAGSANTASPGEKGALPLTPAQQAAVARAQQQFIQDVGGLNQDPNDPAYSQRWQYAQMVSDDMLRAQLGWSAFNSHQLDVAQKAQSAASAGK